MFNEDERIRNMIDKQNKGWSRHLTLYPKNYVEPERTTTINMIETPNEFRTMHFEYPHGNKTPFEHYFYQKFKEIKPATHRTYLPIFWTSYYVNNDYGQSEKAKKWLQQYIDSLDKTIQYFTIVQYDDGILNDLSGLDILVYSMGCKAPGYYPMPLISQPVNNNKQTESEKSIDYSFIGSNTHEIREQLIDELGNSDVMFAKIPIENYYNYLRKTKYALCPRGYGITSFRMAEAMAFGCVPVYISDEFWEPFNIPFDYGIKVRPHQIKQIPEIIKNADYPKLKARAREVYEKYFVYSSCFNAIIYTLT